MVAVQWGNTAVVRGASASLDNVLIHILGMDVPELLQLLTGKLDVVLAMNTHEEALLPCLGHALLTCHLYAEAQKRA